jgi:hypothetical protein
MSVATLTVSDTRLMHARSQRRSDRSHCCDGRSYSGPEPLAGKGDLKNFPSVIFSSRGRQAVLDFRGFPQLCGSSGSAQKPASAQKHVSE